MIQVTNRKQFSIPRNYRRLLLFFCLFCTLVGAQRAFSAQLLQSQTIATGPHGQIQSAVKIGANGNPVIAYNRSGNVAIVRCGDTLCRSGNSSTTISGSGGSLDLAMVLDANDNPVISYYYTNNADLRLLRCGNPTCTSENVIRTIDSVGNVGKYNSVQLDSNGNPVIAYYDVTNRDLKLIRCIDLTCTPGSFTPQVVDGTGTGHDVGEFASMVLDNHDNPVISYRNNGTGDELLLAHCTDPSCHTKHISLVDPDGNTGYFTSITLNSLGNPVISYHNGTFTTDRGTHLRLVQCGNPNCSAGNIIRVVDIAGESTGLATSLALDSNDLPRISYSDNTNQKLKLVLCGTPTCDAPNYTFIELDTIAPSTISWVYSAVTVDANDNTYVVYGNGNSASNGKLTLTRIIDDSVAPTANPSQSPSANAAGWNNSDVTVTWQWQDNSGGSGIDSANCTASTVPNGEGVLPLSATCQDLVGNSGSAAYTVQVDKTLPTLVAAPAIAPNEAGWYQNDVTVLFTCQDDRAGIPVGACPANQLLQNEGNAVASVAQTVVDAAGNVSLPSNVVTVRIDKSAPVANPTLSALANAAGWHNAPVTVDWQWAEPGGSGLAPAHCTHSTTSSGEGSLTLTATCRDLAGNQGNAAIGVQVDSSAPSIQVHATKADGSAYLAGEWSNQAVTLYFTCSDATSQVISCPREQLIDAEGVTPSVSGTATDLVGHQATVTFGPIQLDRVKPVITGSRTPAANGAGWNQSDVVVAFSCTDNEGGAGLATNSVAGATVTAEGIGQSVTNSGVCTDLAGNQADARTVGDIHIDKTAPTLQPVVNPNPVTVGGVATADAGANEALSGVATASCGALDTTTPGVKSVTCTAQDNADNVASATVNYTVNPASNGYVWGGFTAPLVSPPLVNSVQAGAALPIKFSLGGDFGLAVLAAGYPVSQPIVCGSDGSTSLGPLEATVANGGGLQFDPTTNLYSYVWKTNKTWANTCRRLIIRLSDGSEQIALLQFAGRGRSDDGAPEDVAATPVTATEAQKVYLPLMTR